MTGRPFFGRTEQAVSHRRPNFTDAIMKWLSMTFDRVSTPPILHTPVSTASGADLFSQLCRFLCVSREVDRPLVADWRTAPQSCPYPRSDLMRARRAVVRNVRSVGTHMTDPCRRHTPSVLRRSPCRLQTLAASSSCGFISIEVPACFETGRSDPCVTPPFTIGLKRNAAVLPPC